MPINPNIHLTKADVVRVRRDDVIEAADYFEAVAGNVESAMVQPIHEVNGTIQHPFAHIREELADTEPQVDREAANVTAASDYEQRRVANTTAQSQPGTVTDIDYARQNVAAARPDESMSYEEMLKAAQERPAA
jgi:hypothetical protein